MTIKEQGNPNVELFYAPPPRGGWEGLSLAAARPIHPPFPKSERRDPNTEIKRATRNQKI